MSYKELKEAYRLLQASFRLLNRQLTTAKNRVEVLTEDIRNITSNAKKEARVRVRMESSIKSLEDKIKDLERDNKNLNNKYLKDISEKEEVITKLKLRLSEYKTRSMACSKSKYAQSQRASNLATKLKETKVELAKFKKLANKPPITKYKTVYKVKKERVYVDKVVKEPLPQKLRTLMLNVEQRSLLDTASILSELVWFSNKTKLTLKQMSTLLDASNLKYFQLKQLSNWTVGIATELEYKNLIGGDRRDGVKATGWFITDKGKRIADMIVNRINRKTLNRDYIKNAGR